MPSMLRLKSKATKIAYAILGKPENMTDKKTKEQKRVNARLIFEETARVR